MIESATLKFITPENFNDFTYSKNWHFNYFKINKFDTELFKKEVDPFDCDLKVYQDLFMYCFIKDNIGKGSKILDIGGGHSRILKYFKDDYECWNLDNFEGIGNGPTKSEESDFKIIYDYIGNFNNDIPDDYFDLVFSISSLEHVPHDDGINFENIVIDINRILKPGGYSVHCLDCIWNFKLNYVWSNPITKFFSKMEIQYISSFRLTWLLKILICMVCQNSVFLKAGRLQQGKLTNNSANHFLIMLYGKNL